MKRAFILYLILNIIFLNVFTVLAENEETEEWVPQYIINPEYADKEGQFSNLSKGFTYTPAQPVGSSPIAPIATAIATGLAIGGTYVAEEHGEEIYNWATSIYEQSSHFYDDLMNTSYDVANGVLNFTEESLNTIYSNLNFFLQGATASLGDNFVNYKSIHMSDVLSGLKIRTVDGRRIVYSTDIAEFIRHHGTDDRTKWTYTINAAIVDAPTYGTGFYQVRVVQSRKFSHNDYAEHDLVSDWLNRYISFPEAIAYANQFVNQLRTCSDCVLYENVKKYNIPDLASFPSVGVVNPYLTNTNAIEIPSVWEFPLNPDFDAVVVSRPNPMYIPELDAHPTINPPSIPAYVHPRTGVVSFPLIPNPAWSLDVPRPVGVPYPVEVPALPGIVLNPDIPIDPDIPISPDLTGITGALGTLVGIFTTGLIGNLSDINWDKLKMTGNTMTTKFPFSIPWDIGNAFDSVFGSVSVTDPPSWNWTVYGHTITITIPDILIAWFPYIRGFILVLFDIGIIYAIRQWLGGAS